MLGFSEAELKERRWQDVTLTEEIGGGEREGEAIVDGSKDEYYRETVYVRKDGSQIGIGLFVRKYPPYGPQAGFVVFGKVISAEGWLSDEYAELKAQFQEIEQIIGLIRRAESENTTLKQRIEEQARQIEQQAEEIDENRELFLGLLQRGEVNVMGTKIEGDGNRVTRTNNSSSMIYFICTVLIAIAGTLAYIAYTIQNNPQLEPPALISD